jgi:hypothetical protein
MAATLAIQEGNGSGPTWTTVTLGRFCLADLYNPGDQYPCVVPAGGFNYSYWKHFRLYLSGSFTKINNVRFYTSGNIKTNWALGTGGAMLVCRRDSGPNGCPAGNYAQAHGSQGVSGTYVKDETNGHAYYKGQTVDPTDADTYTSANPLLIDNNDYTSEGGTYAVVLQLKFASDATQGEKPNESLTFLVDEI